MNVETHLLPIDHPEAISLASGIIKNGGVIAFPTDTVYGIGASAFDEGAIERIFEIKERSKDKAIPILISDRSGISLISSSPDQQISQIMDRFWPGPLTLILSAAPELPTNLSTTGTIGIRIPDHDATLDLLQATGPLAATSANLSGEENTLTAQEVLQSLGGKIDLVLDGGKSPGGVPSTVLDCTSDPFQLLREGEISESDILELLKD
jgi:L-threonylcarbamoyladenylate synthase